MAFGLYKPGQGYWMRVVTASMLAALLLATAMWVASEAKRIGATLPKRNVSIPVSVVSGAPAPGSIVSFLSAAKEGEIAPVIGTAKIAGFDTNSGILTVSKAEFVSAAAGEREIQTVRVDAVGQAPAFLATVTSFPTSQDMIEPLYLQGGSAAVAIILGSVLIYWFCAVKPSTVDFLINTDMEMKKVNWSTRKDIIASTYVVIGSAFLIAFLIFSVDLVCQWIFRAIGVLHV